MIKKDQVYLEHILEAITKICIIALFQQLTTS